jgi:porin
LRKKVLFEKQSMQIIGRQKSICARSRVHRFAAFLCRCAIVMTGVMAAGVAPAQSQGRALPESSSTQSHPHALPQGTTEDTKQNALSLEFLYTADLWSAATGGVRRGVRYLDNVDVLVQADLDALTGWTGARAFAYGLYNNGVSLNALMGDAQVASNIETGVRAVRLYEAWIEQEIGDKTSLRVGLYDLNSEFDSLEASSLFMGSAHGIGTDISKTGRNGPSIFPVTSLAARLAVDLDDRWTVRTAILDGVPGNPARPAQSAIKLSRDDGALLIGEIEHKLADGKLIAGAWHYTTAFDRIDGGQSRANRGVYLRGETHLTHEKDSSQGLAGFFRLGIADNAINKFGAFGSLGLTYTGPIRGRDGDQLGVAVAVARTSRDYRITNVSENQEVVVELTYRMPITRFLTVQPNVQYVVNPDVDPALRNAVAIGLRTEWGFSL